jgi:hypothetical protein
MRKQKQLYWVLETSAAFSEACIRCFPHVWCSPVKDSCVTETVHQTIYSQLLRYKESGNVSLSSYWQLSKNEMPGSVRRRTFDAPEKIHPCTSTTDRQLTDCREQGTTWRDLRGLLYSHSDSVCLLIQSNRTELQPTTSIFIHAE